MCPHYFGINEHETVNWFTKVEEEYLRPLNTFKTTAFGINYCPTGREIIRKLFILSKNARRNFLTDGNGGNFLNVSPLSWK